MRLRLDWSWSSTVELVGLVELVGPVVVFGLLAALRRFVLGEPRLEAGQRGWLVAYVWPSGWVVMVQWLAGLPFHHWLQVALHWLQTALLRLLVERMHWRSNCLRL